MLNDSEIRHVRAMLNTVGAGKCATCEEIRAKLAFELKHRQAQRRIYRDRNRRGV